MRNFIQIVEQASGASLFHTTGPHAAHEILTSRTLRPKNYDSFVSLSEKPLPDGDIQDNGCTLIFAPNAFGHQVVPVQYTDQWYEAHTQIAAYIAGEGWEQQFEPSDFTDDDGWEDDEAAEQERDDAQREAFLWKANEHEHVSIEAGHPVAFRAEAVIGLMVHDGLADDWRDALDRLGYQHVVLHMGTEVGL